MSIDEFLIYQECVKKWGIESQLLMVLEEMNELGVVLCHSMRANKPFIDVDNLAEEIADVRFMLDQLQFMASISNQQIQHWRNKKIKRLKELLEIETDEEGNIF